MHYFVFFLTFLSLIQTNNSYAIQKVEKKVRKYDFNTKLTLNPIHGKHQETSTAVNGNNSLFKKRELTLNTNSVLITPEVEYNHKSGLYLLGSTSLSISHTAKRGQHQEVGRFNQSDSSNTDMASTFDSKNSVKIYSVQSGFRFKFPEYYFSLTPHVGFDYQNFEYRLGRFERSYPQSDFSSHQGIARDGITYKANHLIPYLGGEVALLLNTFRLGVSAQYAPRVISTIKEEGVVKNELTKGKMKGDLFGLGLNMNKTLGKRFNIVGAFNYQVMKIKGDGEHTSLAKGSTVPIQQKIDNKHIRVGFGLSYKI